MISIITPTFNRAYILPQCYESLCKQRDGDFEWIVVDDGSTDNTECLVKDYIAEGRITIKYFKQKNGGKHRAHNLGVRNAIGELSVCLDSDDMLSPDAIGVAKEIWKEKSKPDSIGILALRGNMENHEPICSQIPEGIEYSTMTRLRDKYGFQGDTVLFFKTVLLKDNLFREYENERFLTEYNLYCDLDRLGTMILCNRVLYYCEYLPDGLTAKYHKLLFDNPKGAADTYYKMSLMADSLILKFKYASISNAYNSLLTSPERIIYNNSKIIMNLSKLGGFYFFLKYLKQFRSEG